MAKKVEAAASNLNLEAELQNNSKYRSFSNDVIANLQTFDKAKEWADLINCMQKLQKVILLTLFQIQIKYSQISLDL